MIKYNKLWMQRNCPGRHEVIGIASNILREIHYYLFIPCFSVDGLVV